MKPRGWSFTAWALAISGTLGFLLAGLILHLDARAKNQEELLAKAKADYEMLIKLRLKFREQEIRKAKMPPTSGQDNQSWQVFLAQKATEAGLPQPNISEEPARGTLKENAFTVSMNATGGAVVSRRNFVKFLDLVESQRPSFKSKTLIFKFSPTVPDEFQSASATFSHFER
jgi:hypothetical protein